ncbi:CGNR zinc finger domain-containing protein [Streptomyces sp. NPDC058682]|uniref:CGNR zinc finger domain-containing protein n=1 Tax=Streptomyces sp. NPDC058682 TaxID=3346596 RepID=UPI003661EEAB
MTRRVALSLPSRCRSLICASSATVRGTTHWVQEQGELLAGHVPAGGLAADEDLRLAIIELRQAVRALFARAVSPAPPSPADAHRLMTADQARARLNTAAAREPVAPQLDWPAEGVPTTRLLSAENDPYVRLVAALARAAIDFLSGPQCTQLRSCTAPRCVRYFVKSHGRQEWCKPSCGNRARAARHYRRQRTAVEGGSEPS